MKIRLGHVSNSSSSSFVCDLCGSEHSGWDLPIRDIGGFECSHGHTICCYELEPTKADYLKYLKDGYENADEWTKFVIEKFGSEKEEDIDIDELADYCYDFYFYAPDSLCPICSMAEICDRDLKTYLRTLSNIPEGEVMAYIKETNRRRRKVYDNEYVDYVLNKLNVSKEVMIDSIKANFDNYNDFTNFKG